MKRSYVGKYALVALLAGLCAGTAKAQTVTFEFVERTVNVQAKTNGGSNNRQSGQEVVVFTERINKPVLSESKALEVFPNPARDFIEVRTSGDRVTTLEVSNQSGNRLLSQPIPKDGKIDVSKMPPGVYILTAKGHFKSYSKKFLVAR